VFRYLVLGLLRSGAAQHGYALMKAYCERSGTRMSTGSFYRELARLVGDGLVTTATRSPDADPRRAPYRISEQGAAAFDGWLAGPHRAAMGSHDDELSVAILFLAQAEQAVAFKLFRSLQEDLWMRSKTLERARDAATARADAGGGPTLDPLDLLLARRQKHVAAEIEFLEELRAAYEAWTASEQTRRPTRTRAPDRVPPRRTRKDGR
jgi:DNA-binding PadR family transcriptional regulator